MPDYPPYRKGSPIAEGVEVSEDADGLAITASGGIAPIPADLWEFWEQAGSQCANC